MTENLLLGGLVAFCITFYAIPKVLKIAIENELFDIPNKRKVHKQPIPSLGGVGIFAGFIISLLLVGTIDKVNYLQYFILTFVVVFFFGVKDDLIGLPPQKKMLGQIIAAAILTWKANILLTNMHGFLGIHSIIGTFSYILTFLTIIVVMNAYNLIDGIDGLAATISIITSGVFAWFFYANGDFTYSLMGFAFAGSLMAFLIFNYAPAKIFMGDTGSMMCGIVNAILVIHFIETSTSSKIFQVTSSPALGFGILIMPLLDTLRVFAIRILNGKSPFFPDRNHLHHILLDRGLSHKVITMIIGSSAIAFILLTYVALPLGTTTIILSQIGLFFLGVFFLQITAKKNKAKLRALNREDDVTFAKKIKHVVTLITAKDQNTRVAE
ncbi:MAG: MraY family glycosyltransferase [Bacteroidetes bacterium]|nr:MraY family glycosyltransferase [Bacteroidota bacterium]